MTAADWIGAEAGPAGLQLWVASAGQVVAQCAVPIAPGEAPRAALAAALARIQPKAPRGPILACGLPGAAERALPCAPFAPDAVVAEGGIFHLPTLVQTTPPVQVPAGAALRLAGCLAADPGFDGVVCLTGAESLWAEVSAGEVVGVMAALSGAMAGAMLASPWFAAHHAAEIDLQAFDADLSQTLSRPERLARMLAEARALPAPQARARIHAALIGAELAAARPWWLGRNLRVLGPGAALYARALAAQGLRATEGDGEAALLAGFALAARAVAP
ncbi:MAG: 2-dehydro-3-deoxygalactonokinase [Rhodobacteraceae bacterium]|nr:2-dehydro-3-deoxygalactonokinase [Paracoccaceae bacterium]